ncbi:hypothetical protein Droror1_Dr00004905 [Drosera rotundifolia]
MGRAEQKKKNKRALNKRDVKEQTTESNKYERSKRRFHVKIHRGPRRQRHRFTNNGADNGRVAEEPAAAMRLLDMWAGNETARGGRPSSVGFGELVRD